MARQPARNPSNVFGVVPHLHSSWLDGCARGAVNVSGKGGGGARWASRDSPWLFVGYFYKEKPSHGSGFLSSIDLSWVGLFLKYIHT